MINVTDILVDINGNKLANLHSVKYLGVFVDDILCWKPHVNYITNKCCQRIGMFKHVLPYLTNDVALLYYNAFIKSCFSYCLMFWIHNVRSGRYKLIKKIDCLIELLAKRKGLNVTEYVARTRICDVM
jgi:hypothetical protein